MLGSGGDGGMQDMGWLRQRVWASMEERIGNWASEIRSEVHRRRSSSWDSRDEAIENAALAEDKGIKEDLMEQASTRVQKSVVELSFQFFLTKSNPEDGMEGLKQSASKLIAELHNPSTQEALLLYADEEYRDDVRDMLQEIGQLIWGTIDLGNGNPTEEMWFVADLISQGDEERIGEIIENIDGVERDDAPEWFGEQWDELAEDDD